VDAKPRHSRMKAPWKEAPKGPAGSRGLGGAVARQSQQRHGKLDEDAAAAHGKQVVALVATRQRHAEAEQAEEHPGSTRRDGSKCGDRRLGGLHDAQPVPRPVATAVCRAAQSIDYSGPRKNACRRAVGKSSVRRYF
jgi:hypothetical protein